MCACMYYSVYVGPRGQLQKSVLSFHLGHLRGLTHIIRLGSKCLYPLGHLVSTQLHSFSLLPFFYFLFVVLLVLFFVFVLAGLELTV